MAVVTSEWLEGGKVLNIRIEGRFDFSCHQEFRNAYENLGASNGAKPGTVVIDLKGTTYLDSSALGMLLLLRDHAGGDNADVRLINISSDTRKILAISNFDKLFQIQ